MFLKIFFTILFCFISTHTTLANDYDEGVVFLHQQTCNQQFVLPQSDNSICVSANTNYQICSGKKNENQNSLISDEGIFDNRFGQAFETFINHKLIYNRHYYNDLLFKNEINTRAP